MTLIVVVVFNAIFNIFLLCLVSVDKILLFWIPLFQYILCVGPSWSWSHASWIYNYLCNKCLSPLQLWVRIPFMGRCIRYIIICDKVCQWLAPSRWFSPGTPVSSTNKIDSHAITEILLKVALNTIILILTPNIYCANNNNK